MQKADIRKQWEGAAPGWAKWEATVANWIEPATMAMLAMADVDRGARVLDLASRLLDPTTPTRFDEIEWKWR